MPGLRIPGGIYEGMNAPFNQLACQWFIAITLLLELFSWTYFDFHERPARKPKRWAGFAGTLIGWPIRVLIFLSAGAFSEIVRK